MMYSVAYSTLSTRPSTDFIVDSLIPRPCLPAFNVAHKKWEEGLVGDVTCMMQRIEAR